MGEVIYQKENVWFSNKKASAQQPKMLPYLTVLEFNSDGNLLLGACDMSGSCWTGSLWLFKHPDDAPVLVKTIAGIGVCAGASDAKFMPCGKKLVAADYAGSMFLLDILRAADDCPVTITESYEFKGHDDYVTSIAIDRSGLSMITGSMDCRVMSWDISTGFRQQEFPHASAVSSVSLKPKEYLIFASGTHDGSTFLWDGRIERPASLLKSSTTSLSSVDWINDHTVAMSDWSGNLSLVDTRTRQTTASERLSLNHGVRKIRTNLASQTVSCAVDDLSVQVFSGQGGILRKAYESRKHSDFASGLAWTESGILYSAGWDSQVLSHTIPELPFIPNVEKEVNNLDPFKVVAETDW